MGDPTPSTEFRAHWGPAGKSEAATPSLCLVPSDSAPSCWTPLFCTQSDSNSVLLFPKVKLNPQERLATRETFRLRCGLWGWGASDSSSRLVGAREDSHVPPLKASTHGLDKFWGVSESVFVIFLVIPCKVLRQAWAGIPRTRGPPASMGLPLPRGRLPCPGEPRPPVGSTLNFT